MSDSEEDSNISSSFGSKLCSSSLMNDDDEVVAELSKIICNDATPEVVAQNVKELNERNELKSAYKKQESKSTISIKEDFDESKIKATDLQLQSNLNQENYQKVKSNEVNQEDDLFLKIEDFPENPISDQFLYEQVLDKIKPMIPIFEQDLKNMKLGELKWNNIKQGKRLEVMVENTYGYDRFLKDQMVEELCFLKRVINCWRGVAGDGNCFYRSAIFSWLEYLIFNKKINTLKIVIANLYVKFDVSYKKVKTLPFQYKKQFTTEEKYVAITILEIIIRFLKENNIKEAYITLLKAFNVTRVFDRVMIFYLRFLLYEYISDNQDKLFKKDFPVCLGNLLPQEYETEDGKFLYNEYFLDDLLKFYTCAEKLAVYLVPYILKVNLNIVFYYFGKDCDIENKFFSCELPNKDKKFDTINVLYRKAHYDVCYFNDYYNNYKNLLDIYCNLNTEFKGDFYILDPNLVVQQEKILNKLSPFDENKSVIFNRVLFNKQRKEIQNKMDENKEKIENKMNIDDIKKYSKYIYEGIINNKDKNICFICNKETKNDDKIGVLPCNCIINFCSDECKNNYYKYLSAFFNKMEFNVNIKCGKCKNVINRTKFIENLNFVDENARKELKNKMIEFYKMYCMNCLNPVDNQAKIVICKCPQLHKLLDTNKFEHKLCKECKSSGNCKICNLYHSRLMSQ